jgi:hypothetical protein
MDNENVIDFGKWTVPTKWEDVTLEMFQKIEKYYSDKDKDFDVREVLDIFTDHTRDEIDQLPINFTDKLLNELSFLKEQPNYGDASPKIEINGEEYCINVMEKLKTGEYVSIDTILKNDSHDYISILAVLCRKNGEIYDSKFEAEVFEERQKLFAKQPITKIMPLISFFLSLFIVRMTHSQLYSEVEEGLNLMEQNIESSRANGDLSALSTRRLMKKLKKLRKSLKSI